MTPADTLLQFCASIGISSDEVKAAESLSGYHLRVTVPSEGVQSLSVESLENVEEAFGPAVELTIGLARSTVHSDRIPTKADLDRAKRIHGEVEIDLTLNKSVLLKQHDLVDDSYNTVLYIFEENLINGLEMGLLALDRHIFSDRHKRTLILLLEGDLYYKGHFLGVATYDHLPRLEDLRQPIGSPPRQRVDRYHQVAFDSLNWVGFQFENITPLHFLCHEWSETAQALASIIRRYLFQAAIIYTATRSVHRDGSFSADYASSEQTATLTFPSDLISEVEDSSLLRFILWPYSSAQSDRLEIFQNVVARELQAPTPEENYWRLVRQFDHILHKVRWNHRVYITGEIDKHFEQIQKVADYVSSVAKDVSDSVDAITKSLTDTLLATISVILASFVAAIVKNETSAFMFKLGMRVYAGYIILQLVYRMTGIFYSYRVLQRDAKEQLQTYQDVLGKERVDDLRAPIDRHNLQFYIWFSVTVLLYIALAVVTWLLGGGFVSHLAQQGVISPLSTPTISPTVPPTS